VDGGASVNNMLMQLQADVMDRIVVRPKITETTALGAAYLAGLAVGYWNNINEIQKYWQEDKRFTPGIGKEKQQKQYRTWQRAVERSKGWANEE
jgi:glycerol kinase